MMRRIRGNSKGEGNVWGSIIISEETKLKSEGKPGVWREKTYFWDEILKVGLRFSFTKKKPGKSFF